MKNNLNVKVLDIIGVVYCVTLLTFTKQVNLSYPKVVYCIFLLVFFTVNFYVNSIKMFFTMPILNIKWFSLWILLSTQLMSPILQQVMNLLTVQVSLKSVKKILRLEDVVTHLGYWFNFPSTKNTWKLFSLSAVLVVVSLIDISSLLYRYNRLSLMLDLKVHLAYILCASCDVCNQIHQIRLLQFMKQLVNHMKQTLKEKLINAEKEVQLQNLKLVKQLFSSLSYIAIRFNIKYSVYLLYICFKTIITAAPFICNIFIEKFIGTYIFNEKELDIDDATDGNEHLLILWLSYQLINICFVIGIYDDVSNEVNDISTDIHDLITTGQVDDIADELFSFSFEILHTDFHFNACGFFKIDFTLIFMVISNIGSYAVYLIQFQVTSNSLSGSAFNIQSNLTLP